MGIYHFIRYAIVHWGYLAVIAGLMGEDAGLPVPGETTLLYAGFLANKTPNLKIQWVVVCGIAAAIMGDNIGFLVGRKWGKFLIRWIKKILRMDDDDVGAARDQIQRHGGATIFWARYIFGLRTVAGPLAGMLGMEWRRFILFNALGALTWVTAISMAGFGFAGEFHSLLSFIEKVSFGLAGAIFLTGYLLWRRQKRRYKERKREGKV